MSVRTQRVANEVRKALSPVMNLFANEHGGGMLTITEVSMSADLSIAKIYLSVFASRKADDEILRLLKLESFRFKRALATQLRLRIVPELRFFIDRSLDDVERITDVLKSNPPFHNYDDDAESHEHP